MERGKKQIAAKDYGRAAIEFQNAVKAAPRDAEPYYQLGLALLNFGKTNEGFAALLKATQLNANHAAAQVKLAELVATSRNRDAIEVGEKRMHEVLKASPDNVDALDALALAEFQLGKLEDSEKHLQQALKKLPRSLKSSMILARLDLARHDRKGAEEVLKKAVDLAPQSVEAVIALGELYMLTGRWNDAEVEFQRAVKIDPKNAAALVRLAEAQVRSGKRDQAERTYAAASALPDKRYKHVHAVFLFRDGKKEAAVQEFERLFKQNSKDRAARSRLVAAYLLVNRPSEAEKILTSALKANPKDIDGLLQRAPILLRSGKDEEARNDLTQVLRYRPDSATAHHLLARIHQIHGKPLLQREELGEALKHQPDLLQARLELAENLLRSRSVKYALDVLAAAPAEQKSMLPFIIQHNWALVASGDQKGFREGIDEGLARFRAPELLLQDVVAKMAKQNYTGARASLTEVLKQTPEELRALRLLAVSYESQRQPAKTLQMLREHAAQHPKSASVQQFLGEWLAGSGQPAEARAAFAAAKAADPKFTAADLALAQLDISEGKLDNARTALYGMVSSDGGNIRARVLLAVAETRTGNYQAAIEQYRKIVGLDASNVVALNNLAYLLTDLAGQPDEGLKYAQQAQELAPGNVDVEGTIGWAFYRKGLYDTALRYLQDAVSKDSDVSKENAAIRKYHLAMTYLKLGDRKRGVQTLDSAGRMNPNLAEAKAANQVLREMTESK